MTEWKLITEPIKRKVLVTNNLNGRDAFGQMSHIWVANLVQHDDSQDGPHFICFADGMNKIWNLTHYAEIPQ